MTRRELTRPRRCGVAYSEPHGDITRWSQERFRNGLEGIISTAEPHIPFDSSDSKLKGLRKQLDQDARVLASLNPDSDAYQRLQDRIEAQTTEMLDYEQNLDRQRRAAAAAEAERQRANEETGMQIGGLVFIGIGATIVWASWGSW